MNFNIQPKTVYLRVIYLYAIQNSDTLFTESVV